MTMALRGHIDPFIMRRKKQSNSLKYVVEIKEWMDTNRLHMNSKKTEYITFGSSKHLMKNNVKSIDINGDLIAGSTYIRYLGVWADQQLTFKHHIA